MNLYQRLNHIQSIIQRTELESGRKPGSVSLIAASKHQSIETIQQAFELGISNFGENYFQEAQSKINALNNPALCWHFIGSIQSNKCKRIAQSLDWVHSLNRLDIAAQLNEYRLAHAAPLNLCLQINLVPEKTKSGIPPEQAAQLATAVQKLPRVKLRGLMTLPPPQENEKKQYELFLQLHQLMISLNQKYGLNMDTLSMGTSQDMIPAIKAGATLIRIGQALFGQRTPHVFS